MTLRCMRAWTAGVAALVLALLDVNCGRPPSPSVPASPPGQQPGAVPSGASGYAPRRHPEAAFRETGDEGGIVVLPTRSEVKVLNPVGSRVFSLLDGKNTVEDIARAVTDEFEVDYETALKDVKKFLEELRTEGMLADDDGRAMTP